MQQQQLGQSPPPIEVLNYAPRPLSDTGLFGCSRLQHWASAGLESRCSVGWHGRSFRDFYRFSSPMPRAAALDQIASFYAEREYTSGPGRHLRFTHKAKRFANVIGVSELRYSRAVRVVVNEQMGVSVIKIAYRIKCAVGVRVIGGKHQNAVEKEVLELVRQCYTANPAAA